MPKTHMTNHRAYSVLELKSVDDDKRSIEGIATTPSVDRMGDIVETEGIEFKLPLPLLYQHDSKRPIGHVVAAKVGKNGITIKAQLAPQGTAGFIDEAWALIKAGLVRGLSIGFRSLEHAFMDDGGGIRFIRTEWMELSAVTIPAQAQASILTVKSADLETLAALGHKRNDVVRLANLPGVSGPTVPIRKHTEMTTREQMTKFADTRAASVARMEAIMTKAGEDLSTLDADQTKEYDDLAEEVKTVDAHLLRLKNHEAVMLTKATVINQETAGTQEAAAAARQGSVISVKSNAPKGIGMARLAIAMVRSNNNPYQAMEVAKQLWPDSPEIGLCLKTAVEAGDTTTSGWASQLVPAAQQMNDEFLGVLRPETIIGRIPGLRRVPFNIAIPIETASGTAQWVGEGANKPVTKLTLSSVTLRWAKAAAIVAITKELAKFSRPDAEMVVRDSMVATLVRFFDAAFVSAAAEVSNVSPAGILNGISATSTSGTTAAAFRTDMKTLLAKMTVNNVPLSSVVLLMSATQAVAMSLMVTDLGIPLFDKINRMGGTILGFPVVISEAVGTKIIALNANEILLAEDPGVQVDVSDTASVEMDTEPIQGETSPVTNAVALRSFWQANLIGIRVEQFITWKVARATAVEYLNGNAYSA